MKDISFLLPDRVEGVDYDTDRWAAGIPHNPKSEEIVRRIANLDFYLFDDSFGFKVGGDGDNGETLMYLLDIYFDEKDKEKKNENCKF